MKKFVSAKELATHLGIKETTLYKHAKAQRIPAVRVGKLWRFDLEKIDELLQAGKLFERDEVL